MTNLRDYGLGQPYTTTVGAPRMLRALSGEKDAIAGESPICVNCKCETLCEIEVDVTTIRGNGVGRYLGCPACPWASPMIITVMR